MKRVRTLAVVAVTLFVLAGLAAPALAAGRSADPSVQMSVGATDGFWEVARSVYLGTVDAFGWLGVGTSRDDSPAGITSIFDAGAPAIGGGDGGPIEDGVTGENVASPKQPVLLADE